MKALIYISLLFLSINCFGQTVSKEDFLNDVYPTFIDSTQRSYYLSRGAEMIYPLQDNNFKQLKKQFRAIVDSTVLDQMVKKMLADTTELRWDCAKLHNTNCDFASEFNKKHQIITYYRLSFPVFDDKFQYAIIQVMTVCGPDCGNICIFLFKKIDGHWIAATSADCGIF